MLTLEDTNQVFLLFVFYINFFFLISKDWSARYYKKRKKGFKKSLQKL